MAELAQGLEVGDIISHNGTLVEITAVYQSGGEDKYETKPTGRTADQVFSGASASAPSGAALNDVIMQAWRENELPAPTSGVVRFFGGIPYRLNDPEIMDIALNTTGSVVDPDISPEDGEGTPADHWVYVLPPDTTVATSISNVTSTGATIEWNTDDFSTAIIDFGEDETYGTSIVVESTFLLKNHSYVLTLPDPDKRYYFRVRGQSITGQPYKSLSNNFTTTTATIAGPVLLDQTYRLAPGQGSSLPPLEGATANPNTNSPIVSSTLSLGASDALGESLVVVNGYIGWTAPLNAANWDSEIVSYTVEDQNGDISSADITFIVDTGAPPVKANSTIAVSKGDVLIIDGLTGAVAGDAAIDPTKTLLANTVDNESINLLGATLINNHDGTFSYIVPDVTPQSVSFRYRLVDVDGRMSQSGTAGWIEITLDIDVVAAVGDFTYSQVDVLGNIASAFATQNTGYASDYSVPARLSAPVGINAGTTIINASDLTDFKNKLAAALPGQTVKLPAGSYAGVHNIISTTGGGGSGKLPSERVFADLTGCTLTGVWRTHIPGCTFFGMTIHSRFSVFGNNCKALYFDGTIKGNVQTKQTTDGGMASLSLEQDKLEIAYFDFYAITTPRCITIMRPSPTNQGIGHKATTNTHIHHGTLRDSNAGTNVAAIWFEGAYKIVDGVDNYAIIEWCHFSNYKNKVDELVEVKGTEAIVRHNLIENCGRAIISLRYTKHTAVYDNIHLGINGAGSGYCILVSGSDCLIKRNYFQGTDFAGFYVCNTDLDAEGGSYTPPSDFNEFYLGADNADIRQNILIGARYWCLVKEAFTSNDPGFKSFMSNVKLYDNLYCSAVAPVYEDRGTTTTLGARPASTITSEAQFAINNPGSDYAGQHWAEPDGGVANRYNINGAARTWNSDAETIDDWWPNNPSENDGNPGSKLVVTSPLLESMATLS